MTISADQMTSTDAARVLGVSVRQVRRLVAAGELSETGRVGTNLLVDAVSVNRLAERGSQRGRPWSEETAWAAIELLDEGHTSRLNSAQRSRLRARLREMSTDEFVRMTRRRSTTTHFRASPSFLNQLREHVALTGSSAVAADRETADRFGLAAGGQESVDGYVRRDLLDTYRDEFFLAEDHHGNVTLRATESDTHTTRLASVTAVALDLADSLDTRERSAAIRMLTGTLRKS